MSKNVKKILKFIIDAFTFIIFVLLILIIIAKVNMMVKDKDYFDMFGYSIFNVATGSMKPVINENDIILVKHTDDYSVKDIVTYKSDKSYITHRIISISGNEIVTKGDANNTKDNPITKDDIIGKVVKIYSNLGVWQKILSTPKIIIMIFITLILFDFAFSYKGIENKKNKKIVNKVDNVSFEKVQKKEGSPKLSDEEILELYRKTNLVKDGENVKFEKKEKEFLDYTIRLDLDELQKVIKKEIGNDDEEV